MAAIVPASVTSYGSLFVVRNVAAQANTGQTDWVWTPKWARSMVVHFNITATAGTTPGPSSLALQTTDPLTLDDTNILTLATGTNIANTGYQGWNVGPGVTGIADAGSATRQTVNAALSSIFGFKVLFDRTNADETYTYKLLVEYIGK